MFSEAERTATIGRRRAESGTYCGYNAFETVSHAGVEFRTFLNFCCNFRQEEIKMIEDRVHELIVDQNKLAKSLQERYVPYVLIGR